ncbi:hypothetical protein [Kitasatospora cineracea]|uniref:hypothetical protein n=1 Tax=Kitasatospora cineracea TaxID=88074 RepID=UPI00380F00AD
MVVPIPLTVGATALGYAAAAACDDTPAPGPAETALLSEVLHHAQQPIRTILDHQHDRRTALNLQRAHLTSPPAVPCT